MPQWVPHMCSLDRSSLSSHTHYVSHRLLEGSCQCNTVRFSVSSHTPYPYQLCACSICRKVSGHSGAINLGAVSSSLQILAGSSALRKYNALLDRGQSSERRATSERAFCGECGTMLWVYDVRWPELLHPFANCIDKGLGEMEGVKMVCIMNASKPDWVTWPKGEKMVYEDYPNESIEEWHRRTGR